MAQRRGVVGAERPGDGGGVLRVVAVQSDEAIGAGEEAGQGGEPDRRAAVDARRNDAPVALESFDAEYLRVSYAEMGINTPKRPVTRSPYV